MDIKGPRIPEPIKAPVTRTYYNGVPMTVDADGNGLDPLAVNTLLAERDAYKAVADAAEAVCREHNQGIKTIGATNKNGECLVCQLQAALRAAGR